MPTNDEYEKIASAWYDRKSALMQSTLGAEHGIVMHALIPYEMGGGLDLYFYPNGIEGTGFATKELSEIPTEGSSNDIYDLYEMVMFTRLPLELELFRDESTAFGQTYKTFNAILNAIALYSRHATLNPCETCEFPEDMDIIGGKCLIFDGYAAHPDPEVETFGLLAPIEIFRAEMNYARENGGAKLIDLLKAAGHYPYSDMDRDSVA
ncbi:MAG: suppressor of fused domain protein [Phycisphaerales bacterium]|nr:suppressor of fused domain protein [Phycisphaerales bacterium]